MAPSFPHERGDHVISDRGLHSLTFKKAELLERMRANRDRHRQVFEEALEGYRAQMVAELETMLTDAKAGRRIRRAVKLPEPSAARGAPRPALQPLVLAARTP
jgi:hypothetical protein